MEEQAKTRELKQKMETLEMQSSSMRVEVAQLEAKLGKHETWWLIAHAVGDDKALIVQPIVVISRQYR